MTGAKQPAQKLSPGDVAALSEQIKEREATLNNEDNLGSELVQDKGNLASVIRKDKERLEHDQELIPTSGEQRDRIIREIRRLTELVQKDMPSVNEMDAKLGSRESDAAVQKNIYFHRKHDANLMKLKDLKMRLNPDDPYAGDLERIRPR